MGESVRFPTYDGVDDPHGWLHKCEQIFQSQGTPAAQQVWIVVFFVEGAASQWYMASRPGRNLWTASPSALQCLFSCLRDAYPHGAHSRVSALVCANDRGHIYDDGSTSACGNRSDGARPSGAFPDTHPGGARFCSFFLTCA
jgi:hypothetical protein